MSRTPWRQATVDKSEPLFDMSPDFRIGGWGPEGPQAGRVVRRMRVPAHEETTAQIQGAFPFLAGRGLGAPGAYMGQDRFTKAAFVFDPFRLYEAGVSTNPNILVAGVIGSAKSSLLKTMCLRLMVFGHRWFVPADTKGEYAALAAATGATHVALGPGQHKALNPLYAPPKPIWMLDSEYVQWVEQHRMLLLRALGETASGRPLTAPEDTLLELALGELTRSNDGVAADRMRQPTMPELVGLMIDPTEEMAARVPVPLQVLQDEGRHLALRFRSMVHGALRGVFDGEAMDLDYSAPGLVIDISRIRASEAAVALTMTCGQALADQILTFSEGRWLKILDECWRQIQYPAIVRRISAGQKLARGDSRTAGSSTVIALHRISDLLGAGPEVVELAKGLLADTSTRIIYRQLADQMGLTASTLGLTDSETRVIQGLGKAAGLWKVGDYSTIVDHQVIRNGLEWGLIQTDSRMNSTEIDDQPPVSPERAARAMAEEVAA